MFQAEATAINKTDKNLRLREFTFYGRETEDK